MLEVTSNLSPKLFESPEMAPTRAGFGIGLVEAGEQEGRIVALSADLTESTKMDAFAAKFPARFVEMGVAEQNLVTVASGMANYGKIPFVTSYAAFSPGRNWEQIRTTIALNDVPVKIIGSHAGLMTGPDGATHQMLEDIALMRALPNMVVLSPCDSEEARKMTHAIAASGKPAYMRVAREKSAIMTTAATPFAVGKANVFWRSEKPQVALVGTGPVVHHALLAARELDSTGVGSIVVNVGTIKPLDPQIADIAGSCGAVVSIEEHQIAGGLGGAIAELLAKTRPVPQEFVGVEDRFGQSGTPKELFEEYGLGVAHIVESARKVISRK